MSLAGDEFDDDGINRAIRESLNQLVNLGYVEVIGINEKGEWLYKATEEGKKFAKENKLLLDIDGLDGLGQ